MAHYVYSLMNEQGQTIYVARAMNPGARYLDLTSETSDGNRGKFAGLNVLMKVHSVFKNKIQADLAVYELKVSVGLKNPKS